MRIDGVKLLEKVAGTPKLALAGEGDGLFVGWGHAGIFSQAAIGRGSGAVTPIDHHEKVGQNGSGSATEYAPTRAATLAGSQPYNGSNMEAL